MWRLFLIFLLLSFSSVSRAQWDFHALAALKSYTFGGSLDAEIGYGHIMWGEKTSPDEFRYGYVRPSLRLETSGLYNSSLAQIDFFPISILGVRVGHSRHISSNDYSSWDCSTMECQGTLTKNYLSLIGVVGAGPWFLILDQRWIVPSQSGVLRDVVEPSYGMAIKPENEQVSQTRMYTGVKMAPWTFLITASFIHARSTDHYSRSYFAQAHYTYETWRFVGGIGTFESSLNDRGLSFIAAVAWIPRPSVAIF